jgi:predicted acetyltransferase
MGRRRRGRPAYGAPMVGVRNLREDELEQWTVAMNAGFLGIADEGEAEWRRPAIDFDRTWAAVDGAAIVATLRSFNGTFSVPGGAATSTACLTNVTVASTHRRRGLMSEMLLADLQGAKERGEVLAALIAAEWPIYGRFGYGPATEHLSYEVSARQAVVNRSSPGSVTQVTPAELMAEAGAIHEAHCRATPGELSWSTRWLEIFTGVRRPPSAKPEATFRVVGRDASGRADGFAIYKPKQVWNGRSPAARIDVDKLVATDLDGLARLWQYLVAIDWVATVVVSERGPSDPLPWLLTDARVARQTERADFVWVRPLDLIAALEARSYLTHGRVVLDVQDRTGLAGGRVVLEGGPDGATCRTTTESAGLTVPIDVLSAAYLGGHGLAELARAGMVDVVEPASLVVADAMFRSEIAPCCSTWF